MKKEVNITVNGKPYKFDLEPRTLLVELLRDKMGLTGTKRGCSDGSCETCTVILDGKAVKSCSVLAVQADGKEVLTIEGLAGKDGLHPIQKAFIKNHGLACGYCTPGMIMLAKVLLDENPNPEEGEIREAISGHICRCGTYPKIMESIQEAAKEMRGA